MIFPNRPRWLDHINAVALLREIYTDTRLGSAAADIKYTLIPTLRIFPMCTRMHIGFYCRTFGNPVIDQLIWPRPAEFTDHLTWEGSTVLCCASRVRSHKFVEESLASATAQFFQHVQNTHIVGKDTYVRFGKMIEDDMIEKIHPAMENIYQTNIPLLRAYGLDPAYATRTPASIYVQNERYLAIIEPTWFKVERRGSMTYRNMTYVNPLTGSKYEANYRDENVQSASQLAPAFRDETIMANGMPSRVWL